MALNMSQAFVLCVIAIVSTFAYRWLYQHGPPPPSPHPPAVERPAQPHKTFRVRGVPREWDSDRLQVFLGEGDSVPTVWSLAQEIHGRSLSATVTYRNPPAALCAVPTKIWTRPLPKPPETPAARLDSVTVDADFIGMTTLFAPLDDDNHKVDVIAISGLGGHAFGSFKERGGEYMWLRDALPHDLHSEGTNRPMARLITYGYESAVADSQSIQNLEDLATAFHSSLLPLASSPQTKPIILIAHSLGGLIVKQLLISLARSKNEDDKKIIQAVYGIVFFGVPHDGMDISSLIPMVGGGPNALLVQSISHINSQILSMQQREFHTALGAEGDSEIVCFYETQRSPTARQNENGRWEMRGPPAVLVTKSSATHCRPWEAGEEHICAVARSHSEIVKFGPNDPEYDKACGRLRGLARRAVAGTRRRLAANTRYVVPYNENKTFVGRSATLAHLRQQLGFGQHSKSGVSQFPVSLYGLGGVGKTQIALAYVYWLKEACPEVSVFWVHASNAERFRQSFAQIAEDCQIPGHDDPKTNVLILAKEWLCKKDNGQWLMVIDNADDGKLFCGQSKCATDDDPHINENLAQYVPECGHGKVLATTRNKQVAVKLSKSIRTVEIHKMDESESIQLLGTFTDIDTHEASFVELSTLSSRLEHLPLALVQAAAFIQANGISIKKYLQLLEESDQSLVSLLSKEFESIGRDSEAPQAVAQTWIISFRLIWEQNTLAGSLLSLMSLFDKQAIPMAFLSHYAAQERNGGPKSSIELTESIGLLKAFSLLSEQKGESLDMHRLVQLVTRKWLMNDHAMGQFEQEALLTVSHVYPFGVFENRTLCSAYLPHAKAVLGIKVDDAQDGAIAEALLSHRVASYLNFEGQWSDAEKLYKEALTTRKMVLGEQHPDTLRSMANLASTYRYQGRWKEAEELQVQVMETHKTVLGEQHPDTLTSMANLASTYRNQGRWKEAEELKVQVMKSHKTVLGEQHPDTLISIANLASIYWDQGQWKEAEELEVQVMETRKTVLGEQHPDTLISMGNLASTYWNQGRWKEAEELEVQVMESRKKVLGEQHPDTLISIANLASIYQDQGRWKEAEELEVQVMETRKTVLGEQHPDTLRSIANLASIYRDQGRWKEAEELEVQVIETRKIVLGEQHPDTLTSIANLALTYQNQGRWKEAEELEVQVIETHKTVLGEQHPNTLRSITNLASTYWNQGRWKEAEELEVQAMEIRKTVLGEQHPDTLTSMANLAFTWDSQGSHMEAIKLMESCCRLQQSVLGVSHPHTESTLSTLNKWKLRLIED